MPLFRTTCLRAGIAAAAFISPAAAVAEEGAIVVTAGRTGEAPVATIGREEIELVQPATSLDLLDRLAGVRAFSKGGAGGATYLSIRGGEPNFSLVLLDGARVNDPTNSRGGAFDFGQIDPDALERIEVARGALSAVHGADALSGVVSLQLRRLAAGERLASIRAAADTEEGALIGGNFGAGWGGGSGIVSASWYDSGDITPGSTLERGQGFGRLEQEVAGWGVSALALHSRTQRSLFPEDSGGPRLAANRDRERRDTALTLLNFGVTGPDSGLGQPRLAISWMRQDDDSRTPAIAPGPVLDGVPAIDSDSRFERTEANFDHRLGLGSAEVALGAGYLHESGSSEGSVDIGFPLPADFMIERSVASAFAEATVRPLPGLDATTAVRFDDASTARGEWSGRAALRWSPVSGVVLFASWSEGFKLPSLYALAYPIIANPDLLPERSRTFDAGAEARWNDVFARVILFHSRYADLIDFDAERFTNVNRSRVTARGVEAELDAPLAPAVRLAANLTYLDTDVPAGVPPLRSRPEWQGFMALRWTPSEAVTAEASGAYTSDFFDSSVPTGPVVLEERFVAGAALRYRLAPVLWLTLSGENLLDSDYEDAVGFPAPGRVFRLGIRLRG